MSPEHLALAEHGVLAAYGSAAIVWIVAGRPRKHVESTYAVDPGWWTSGLRALAVVAGCGLGVAMDTSVEGACVGAAGGLFSTTLVALVKARLRALRGGGR